jgi:hypothetical protein
MARDNINDKNRIRRGFFSKKNELHILSDSYLEELFFLAFEFDDSIAKYRSHPVVTTYLDETGKKRKYTPDSAVKLKDDRIFFFEVKLHKRTQNTEYQLHFELLSRHIERRFKSPLKLLTEKNLNKNQLKNWKRLYKHTRKPLCESAIYLLEQIDTDELSFAELLEMNSKLALRPHIPFSILAHHKLVFDYSMPLDDSTKLRVT